MQSDLQRRSVKGQKTEKSFSDLMLDKGYVVYSFQDGKENSAAIFRTKNKTSPTPDFMVCDPWTHQIQFHETKSKYPTFDGNFGLETYRYDALIDFAKCGLSVWYTIQLTSDNAKGKNFISQIGRKEGDWITIPVKKLVDTWCETGTAGGFCRGKWKESLPMYYWSHKLFQSLTF